MTYANEVTSQSKHFRKHFYQGWETYLLSQADCALSMAGCKINKFYPKILPLSNCDEE